MKIVVAGSLGNVGSALVPLLVQHGHTTVVISRKSKKVDQILALNAVPAIGNLEDKKFLTTAFEGAEAVFCMIPMEYEETSHAAGVYEKLATNYVDAIRKSQIRRVVHLSSVGAHFGEGNGFIKGCYIMEQKLRELVGVNVVHLRAGYFYSNLYSYIDMIKAEGLVQWNFGGDDILPLVDPLDIALCATNEFGSVCHTGQVVKYVVSDELSCAQLASVIGAAIKQPQLEWLTITDQALQLRLQSAGLSSCVVANIVEVGSCIHNGKLIEEYVKQRPHSMHKERTSAFAQLFSERYFAT